MSLDGRHIDDLIRIATAGGGMRLNGNRILIDDLVRLAASAKASGARIYLSGLSGHSTNDLVRIGTAGRGSVVFEDEA